MAIVITFITSLSLLGSIFSLVVFLAPMPTFYRVYKKRSTKEIHSSIPYCLALLSCQLLILYGFLKPTDGYMIIIINSIGFALEAVYLTIYIIYAPKPSKVQTAMFILLINFGLCGSFTLAIYLAFQGPPRVAIVGWMTVIISQLTELSDPLCATFHVIMTKKFDGIPIGVSFCQIVCDVMWFFYGLLINDYYIAVQNGLGFAIGITQMILYIIYYIVFPNGIRFIVGIIHMFLNVIDPKPSMHILPAQNSLPQQPNGDLELAISNAKKSPEHVKPVTEEAG